MKVFYPGHGRGTILVCHWGATMSLYTFVEVIKICPKSLVVRELENKTIAQQGYGQPVVVAGNARLVIDWDIENIKEGFERPRKELHIRLYPYKTTTGETWFSKRNGYYNYYQIWDDQPRTENHND